MRAVSFLSGKMLDAMVRAFRAKYPFLDVHVEEQGGSVEAAQRFLLEIKAGMAKNWDANRPWTELYDEYLPHQKKFDIDLPVRWATPRSPIRFRRAPDDR
jgi:hypothetical protein